MNFFLPVKIITYLIICLSFISNSYAEVKPSLLRTVSLTNIVKSPSDVRFNPAGTKIFFSDFILEQMFYYNLMLIPLLIFLQSILIVKLN